MTSSSSTEIEEEIIKHTRKVFLRFFLKSKRKEFLSFDNRLVRRMISEGMKSVKGIGICRNWNRILSDLTSCLVDRKWNGICQRNWNMSVWFAEELEWNAEK